MQLRYGLTVQGAAGHAVWKPASSQLLHLVMHWDPVEGELCVKQLYQGLDLQETTCTCC